MEKIKDTLLTDYFLQIPGLSLFLSFRTFSYQILNENAHIFIERKSTEIFLQNV